jgi:hypothetical protein
MDKNIQITDQQVTSNKETNEILRNIHDFHEVCS